MGWLGVWLVACAVDSAPGWEVELRPPYDRDQDGWSDVMDCDDDDPDVFPTAEERCDPPGRDEDCDGIPEPLHQGNPWEDADGDGWGSAVFGSACAPVASYSVRSGDCDDHDPSVHPDAAELCDAAGRDEDCDGRSTWYEDADRDGVGGSSPSADCATASPSPMDCDDADPGVSPDATEVCGDGLDTDCDGRNLPCTAGLGRGALDGELTPWFPGVPTDARYGEIGFIEDQRWLHVAPTDAEGRPGADSLVVEAAGGGTIADLHGDGTRDVLAFHNDVVYVFSGAGSFFSFEADAIVHASPALWLGDTDGDRGDEVVSCDAECAVWSAPVAGEADVHDIASVELPSAWVRPAGDLDGDGLEDVVGLVAQGAGVFFGPLSVEPDISWTAPANARPEGIGDVTGDGRPDLIVPSGSLEAPILDGPLGPRVAKVVGGCGTVPLGDTDGDGIAELACTAEDQIAIWVGPVEGTLLPERALVRLPATSGALGAHADGDDLADLLLPDLSGPSPRTWVLVGP